MPVSAVSSRLGRLWAWLAPLTTPAQRIDVVGGVTLVLLLLTTEETWILRVGIATFAVAAAVDRRLLRSAAYWLVLLAVYVFGVRGVVLLIDNHEFLLAYWLLALGLSRLLEKPVTGLATSSRLLIGLAFAFATLWKLVSPEYMSGDMFHSLLLFDPRFVGIASAFGGLPLAHGLENYETFETVLAVGDGSVTTPVRDAPGVRTVALGMTVLTVAIEGLIAACFLAPPTSGLGRARHVALLFFLFTTYVLAPVIGFGWLLIALGLAQAPLDRHRWMLPAFGAAFVLVVVRGAAPIGRLLAFF